MYRVEVYCPTTKSTRSLRRGGLYAIGKGTLYSHPSAAIASIEGFAKRREERYTYTIVKHTGERRTYTPTAIGMLMLTFQIKQLPNGGFSVYSREAECNKVVQCLTEIADIAYDWAEQVGADL